MKKSWRLYIACIFILGFLPLSRSVTARPLNIIISPNCTRVAVPTSDGISVHDAHTGDAVSQFTAPAPGEMPPGKMPPSQVLTFSSDASMLASVHGKSIYVSETATGKALAMLEEHPDSITALAFSPDGKLFATADGTWTVHLWEISTGKHIRSLTGHPGQVNALAFSPDSKTFASAGGTLRIWDITTGELRHAPDKDLGSINRICFFTRWQTPYDWRRLGLHSASLGCEYRQPPKIPQNPHG